MLRDEIAVALLLCAAALGCGSSAHVGDAGAGVVPDASATEAGAADGGAPPVADAGPSQDAAAPAELATDGLLAAGCRQLTMTPETPQSLGFQLVLCGESELGRLELPEGKLTRLADVKGAPGLVLVTRQRALLYTPDGVTSVSLDSGEVVTLLKGLPIGLTHDRQHVLIRQGGSIYAQATDGSGMPLQLCAAADRWFLDTRGTRLLCTYPPNRLQSVDVESGAALDVFTSALPWLPDEPVEQLALLDTSARKLRVLRADGSPLGEWSFGERKLDSLLAFTRDGEHLIVTEAERLWSVTLRDGSFHALADRPAGETQNLRVAPRALIFETSPRLNRASGWYDAPVTLSAVPLDGAPVVTLGQISAEYWTDQQWDLPVAYASDMLGALYPSTSGWSLTDFERLTTQMLPLDGRKDLSSIGPAPYGLSEEAALYPLCSRGQPDCVLVVVDRAGHELMRVATTEVGGFFFAPTAEHVVVQHDGVFELLARGGASRRFAAAGSTQATQVFPLVRWLDARRFLYDSEGVHLVQLRD